MTSDPFPMFCPECDRLIYGACVSASPPGVRVEGASLLCPYCGAFIADDEAAAEAYAASYGFSPDVLARFLAGQIPVSETRVRDGKDAKAKKGQNLICKALFMWF